MTEHTAQQAAELVAACMQPFPDETIGKLPRVTCGACRDRTCKEHRRAKCVECGNYITTAHIHHDYVGHAHVTERLLQIDPVWSWEPVAFDDQGAPLVLRSSNGAAMWVRLTVRGVTRLGVGTATGAGPDLLKELIGDAIRNAAMRFGVALHLWAKDPLESQLDTGPAPTGAVDRVTPDGEVVETSGVTSYASDDQVAELLDTVKGLDDDRKEMFRARAAAETDHRRSWSFQDGHRWTVQELQAARAFAYSLAGREPFDTATTAGGGGRSGPVTPDELIAAVAAHNARTHDQALLGDAVAAAFGDTYDFADPFNHDEIGGIAADDQELAAWIVGWIDAERIRTRSAVGDESPTPDQ